MIKFLEQEKLEDILTNELTIVDFYADWCGPCRMLGEVLESINDINIIKINTDTHNELAIKEGIMTIPCLYIYKDKKLVYKNVGFKAKDEIEAILKEYK